jgi:hypothetical protein
MRQRVRRGRLAFGAALVAVAAELVLAREHLVTFYQRAFRNIDLLDHQVARSIATAPPEKELYRQLQASVPAGERLAILLDEPAHLDFGRNPIWNLDMPGYSSLPPGIPFFRGAEALRAYFRGIGVRYLAFVRPTFSRYHYRREYWVEMLANDMEIWRLFAPYLIDFLDSLGTLAEEHKRLFEERGLVVVDLAEGP